MSKIETEFSGSGPLPNHRFSCERTTVIQPTASLSTSIAFDRLPLAAVVLVLCLMPSMAGYTSEKSQGDLVVNCEDLIDIHLPENLRHADFVMRIQYSDRLVCLVRTESVYRACLSRVGLAGD